MSSPDPAAFERAMRFASMRARLSELHHAIGEAERSPMLVLAQPARIFVMLRALWGLLEAIVSQLERSSTDGKPEGTDRQL